MCSEQSDPGGSSMCLGYIHTWAVYLRLDQPRLHVSATSEQGLLHTFKRHLIESSWGTLCISPCTHLALHTHTHTHTHKICHLLNECAVICYQYVLACHTCLSSAACVPECWQISLSVSACQSSISVASSDLTLIHLEEFPTFGWLILSPRSFNLISQLLHQPIKLYHEQKGRLRSTQTHPQMQTDTQSTVVWMWTWPHASEYKHKDTLQKYFSFSSDTHWTVATTQCRVW